MAKNGNNNKQNNKPQAAPTNALTPFGVNNNFGGGAYNNARSAGMTDDQIRALLPGSGLKTGQGVQWVLDNSGNFPSYAGGAGAPLANQQVPSQAYFAPNSSASRFGPNQNISLMAEPYGKSYGENLKFMNDRFWNPSEAEKKKYYDNYQDDLSGGIMPTEKTWATQYGLNKASDMPMVKGQDWYHPSMLPGGAGPGASAGTATGSSGAQTAAAQQAAISKKNSLSKNLKIAQAGGISRNELTDLSINGIDGGKVVRRMDAMNKKGKNLRLNSGAANMLLKQAGPASGGFYGLNIKPMFGTGNIGRALEGMRGTRPSGGYTNPQSGYSMKTPGTEPSFMMGGTQIRKGGRTAVRKQGAQTAAPATTNTTNTTTTTNTPSTIPGPVGAATDGPMDQLQKDYAAMGPGGLYGGGLGGPGASRVRRARSRQQRLGIRGAGTSINNRTSPFFNSLN